MNISAAEITVWIGSFIWPLFRVAALVMTAPVISARSVPVRIRLGLSVAITIVLMPTISHVPVVDAFSGTAIVIIAQQLMIGIVMGTVLQFVMAAVITGGQVVAMQMGLGFSVMVDPQNGAQTPILSQFYVIMVVLIYLAINGHLVLFEVLADSFKSMPIGVNGIVPENLWVLVNWAALIFAGALGIAIPAIASLLIVNFAFGIMTRAAPQLNIFAIGFPITMMIGFAVVLLTLPSVFPRSTALFNDAYRLLKQMLGAGV
jgi:flagellar biosynthetic protein FliR